MGFLEELMERGSRCAFCRLVVNAVCKRRALHLWKSPQQLLESERLNKTQTEYFIYSYFFASDSGVDPREGPSPTPESLINDTYRIGIATRTVSNSTIPSNDFRDHVGTIQLSGDSAPKIGKNEVFHGRKIGQRQVDFRLVKRWLYICENTHGSLCGTTESYELDGIGGMTAPKDLFVIDVGRMCICKSPPRARYLALSYCWPTKYDPFTTTQSNVLEMLAPRSLDKYGDFLPAAINDAIQVVQLLGESYLWVDSLCIVQDDEEQQQHQINQMDLIYSCALLTIICAPNRPSLSTTKYDGLPGCHLRFGRPQQAIEDVSGLRLQTSFLDVNLAIEPSRWATRAWTFQEQMLSSRKLYFTDTQLYFECSCAAFCEDGVREGASRLARCFPGSNLFHKDQNVQYLSIDYGITFVPRDSNVHTDIAFQSYLNLVLEYTRREMKYPEDVLRAFQGVMTAFTRATGMEFIFGLPEPFFHDALLWIGNTSTSRRKFAKYNGKMVPIPGWSWAGWKWSPGGIAVNEFKDFVVRPEVDWVGVLQDGTQIKLRCTVPEQEDDPALEELRSRERWIRPPETAPDSFLASIHWQDKDYLSQPDWHILNYVICWTRVASFTLRGDVVDGALQNHGVSFKFCKLLIISDDFGHSVGSIIMGEEWKNEKLRHPQLFEFMLLSRMRRKSEIVFFDEAIFSNKLWGHVVVMLIERDKDVARRLGVGVIHEDAWIKASPTSMLIKLE